MNRNIRLTKEDKERIRQAVEAAEKRTSGEILPVIQNASAQYDRATWLCSLLGGALASLVLVTLHHWHGRLNWYSEALIETPETMVLAQLVGVALGYVVSLWAPARRIWLSRAHLAETVDAKAKQLFVELGLTRTRDRTGVLVLVSLFERRVEILADEGIHRNVPDGYWDSEVKTLIQGIHAGKFTEALCQVISDIGGKLAEKFPRKAFDINELPDNPVERA